MSLNFKKIVVAFSGGLDTSFVVAWLKEQCDAEIITATVDTGGFPPEELSYIEQRSKEMGADLHLTIDARAEAYEQVMTYCIKGNVLRGGVYPLCVSSERVAQAEVLVRTALEHGADAVAHGSTGAGNDQVRFDVAIRTLAPQLAVLTPIRDLALSREAEVAWLTERNFEVPEKQGTYSINAGMWGVTIGGGETHDAWSTIPEDAWPSVVAVDDAPADAATFTLGFGNGTPISFDGESIDGVSLVAKLNELGAVHGVGRGVHTGDTILGIKGRIAFEAPAAMILVEAHRELEKLVLTRWQTFWKEKLADFYGMLLHEAQYYDPAMRDIEAMIDSSQQRVEGEVRVKLYKGTLTIDGVKSPYSMMDASVATYGETQTLWDGRDADGFTKIYGLQGRLAKAAAGEKA
jgi:argininosuccinate synthase